MMLVSTSYPQPQALLPVTTVSGLSQEVTSEAQHHAIIDAVPDALSEFLYTCHDARRCVAHYAGLHDTLAPCHSVEILFTE